MQQTLNIENDPIKKLLDGLNEDQKNAVVYENGPLLIIAGAGTGKTTVITKRISYLITKKLAMPSEILALTFTEKAAAEMEERVDQLVPYGFTDMWISTFHAFGDRLLRDYSLDLGLPANFKVLTATEQAIFMKQNIYAFDLKYFRPIASPLSHINALLSHFSRLKDELISPSQYIDFAKAELENSKLEDEREEAKRTLELANAYERYNDLMIQAGNLDFGDQIFLTYKLLKENKKVLTKCQEKFKYILVDEYQDTNYAQNEIVKLLASKDENITVVGDDDQCLPGSTKISTPEGEKPISAIKIGDTVHTAVGKGHIGKSTVKNISSSKSKRNLITLITESGAQITATDNHKFFCFIPKEINGKFYVYAMQRKSLGWRIGITNDLVTRLRLERSADRIIGLKACNTEDEARYYEMLWSLQYCIPTVCFKPRERVAIQNDWLEKLYLQIDTEKNIQTLARNLNIDLTAHHFCLDGVVRGSSNRLKININICQRLYRNKNKKILSHPEIRHELSLQTSSAETIEKLINAGYILTDAKKGKRLRIVSQDADFIKDRADHIQKITGGIIENKFNVAFWRKKTAKSLVMPVKNILKGHYVPVLKGTKIIYDRVVQKKVQQKKIEVFDLEIDKTHNYIADNIIVHNSIYRFRGASISNILQFKDNYKSISQIVLNKNYRSSQEILDSSYKLIQHNNPDRLEIKNKINKRLVAITHGDKPELLHCDTLSCEADQVAEKIKSLKIENGFKNKDFAILVRANNQAEPFIQSLNIAGIPYAFSGASGLFSQPEIKMLIALIKSLVYHDDNLSFYRLATSEIYNIQPDKLSELHTIAKRKNRSVFQIAKWLLSENQLFGADAKLSELIGDIDNYRIKIKQLNTGELLYEYLTEKKYLKKLSSDLTVENELKIQNIAKFFDRITQFNHSSDDKNLIAFLESLELILEVGDEVISSDINPDIDAVNILTAHASKGLEWPVVFAVNLVADRFPSRRKRDQLPIPDKLIKERLPEGDYHLEEERRLFYVAATRAKKYLFLTSADDYGGKRTKKISQFVLELLDESSVDKLKHKLSPLEKIERFKKIDKELPIKNRKNNTDGVLKLSRQQIDDYFTCPKKYHFAHIVKIPLLENHFLMYGTAIHAALDHYFNRRIRNENPTLLQLLEDFKRAFRNVGFITRQHEEQRYKAGVETLTKFYSYDQKSGKTPTGVETVFEFLENNIRISGRYDLIYGAGDSAEICDFKTSQVKDQKDADQRIKKSTQMQIYALAWYEKYKTIPKTTLYFIESELKGEKTFSTKELIDVKEMIFEVARGIRLENFAAKPEKRACDFCPYKDICPKAL